MSRKSSLISSAGQAHGQGVSDTCPSSCPTDDLDSSFENVMLESGVILPDHLSSKASRWITLLIIAITGSFASGPIASWPTLEPILIKEGVFAGPQQQDELTFVFSFATCVALLAILLGGIAFDVLGPRAVAAGGAFAAAVCLLLMGLAIKVQSLNYLLWFAYPLASFFGYVQSMGTLAWNWLLPGDLNIVNACVGAIQALSDSFVIIAVILNNDYGIALHVYFFLAAGLSCFAGIVSWVMVPSRQLHLQISEVVNRYQRSEPGIARSYGATSEERNVQDDTYWDALNESRSVVQHACWCCARVHPIPASLFAVHIVCWYMNIATFSFDMYPFYASFVGKADATRLVNIWGILFSVVGASSLLIFGRIVDHVGFVMGFVLAQIPVLVANRLIHFPILAFQIAAQVFYAYLNNAWSVIIPRFCLSYAPPELMGTLFGLAGTVMGLGQVVMTPLSKCVATAIEAHMHQDGHVHSIPFPLIPTAVLKESPSLLDSSAPALKFFIAFDFWTALSFASSLALLAYWLYNPPPEPGSTKMQHVLKMGRRIGTEDVERALERMPLQAFRHSIARSETSQKSST